MPRLAPFALLSLVSLGAGCGAGARPTSSGAAPTPALVNSGASLNTSVPATAGAEDKAATDGPILAVPGGLLKVQVCTDDIVRIAASSDPAFFTRSSLATAPKRCAAPAFAVATLAGETTVTTSKLVVRVDSATGAVTFQDKAGQTILSERSVGGRAITPTKVQGEATHNVQQQWSSDVNESLYGLGQHQQGLFDIKGTDLDLYQHNTEVFIPFLVSSKGYGILWDNTSLTRFGDLTYPVPLPGTTGLYAAAGALPGDVRAAGGSVDWVGNVIPRVTGDYTFRTFSTGAIKLKVNDQVVTDDFHQSWLPNEDIARVRLTGGRPATVRLTWTGGKEDVTLRVLWKEPVATQTTSLWSQVGDGVDYWFVYGPEIDHVIEGYRLLSGTAPMMPRSAFGLWQSKERYRTAQEVLDVLKGYRGRRAPIDNIVQDWQYWLRDQWGSHAFDPARYPDPAAWVRSIHDTYHAKLMISVWPRFYPGTAHYDELLSTGYLYPANVAEGTRDFLGHAFAVYDAFNPAARRLYWSQVDRSLFSLKVDAWWLDSSEPEAVQGPFSDPAVLVSGTQTHMSPTALGSGARMLNAYPLVNSQAVYEGQRAVAPNQRVFILTRSGYAGQQRYAAATWSGDITSTWTAMKKQIPAGLSFSISGMPYWTLDSGGFAVPPRFASEKAAPADRAEWAELNVRWFEYSTFLPIMRVHGQSPAREMWQFGGDQGPAYAAMLKFDRLRYRLLPYTYSLAAGVTMRGGTILRALVTDFRTDPVAREVGDQFMFGPALLVSPVTSYLARTRAVYLPPGVIWYDFWTGVQAAGGQTVVASAPFDAIPIFVRAGSIVPVGPDLQYTSEKPADPLTLYVYAGADGEFVLYEDDGATYDYESGAFSTIALGWNDAKKTLTIGARGGSGFAGMLSKRTFQVIVVSPTRKVGFSFQPAAGKSVTYDGGALAVVLDRRE
jgi:alpha-D-xyloside xylohydrolase